MAFTESNDPKTAVQITFKANCSLGYHQKDYAEFVQKLFDFYYPQHHVHEVVVVRLTDEVLEAEPPKKASAKKAIAVAEEEDFS